MTGGHSDLWRELTQRAARQIADAKRAGRDVDAAKLASALLEDDPDADAALRARLQAFIVDMTSAGLFRV